MLPKSPEKPNHLTLYSFLQESKTLTDLARRPQSKDVKCFLKPNCKISSNTSGIFCVAFHCLQFQNICIKEKFHFPRKPHSMPQDF